MILTAHDKEQMKASESVAEPVTRSEMARAAGMSPNVLYSRMKKGMTLEEALALPVMTPSEVAAHSHRNRKKKK